MEDQPPSTVKIENDEVHRNTLQNANIRKRKRSDKEKRLQAEYDHLYREIHYSKQCLKRHEQKWQSMLVDITEPIMRQEIECAMHMFERSVDAKDFEISLLLDELNLADAQYARAMRLHVDDIDRILVLCYDQIADLWNKSAEIIENLYRAAVTERGDIQRIDGEHETYLKTMMYCQDENSATQGKTMRGEYLSRLEVMHLRLTEIAARYQEEVSFYYTNLLKDAMQFMDDYKTKFAKRKRQNDELLKHDDEMQETLSKLAQDARHCIDTIKMLISKEEHMHKTLNRQIKELTDQLNHYNNIANGHKNQLQKDKASDKEKLTDMILLSDEAISNLKSVETQGDKLLNLGVICRKYETMEEKTQQYPTFAQFIPHPNRRSENLAMLQLVTDPKNSKRRQSISMLKMDPSKNNINDNGLYACMKYFWLRVGALEASRSELFDQCSVIKTDNEYCRKLLWSYCEQSACDEVIQYLYKNTKTF